MIIGTVFEDIPFNTHFYIMYMSNMKIPDSATIKNFYVQLLK